MYEDNKKQRVYEKLQEIIADRLAIQKSEIEEKVKSEKDDLAADFGADSLDLVEMQMDIEDAYKISIPEEDTGKIRTIRSAVDYVSERI